MPYTLAKFFLWGLLMAVAGGIVGWLLRSLKARMGGAAAPAPVTDDAEVIRLRSELDALGPVVAERDRLRMELADVRGSSAGALGFSSTIDDPIIPPDEMPHDITAPDDITVRQDITAPDALATAAPAPAHEPVELDLDAAKAVIGKKVVLDDLTTVEGIGPKIAELCRGIGVTTWSELAATEVDVLQSMLDAAGSRFQMHKPVSWPQQAALLASGRWEEFIELTDSLSGGS